MKFKKMQCYIVMVCFCILCLGSCKDDTSPLPVALPTISPTDSLVMVEFYHSMKGDEWSKRWDLTNPETWTVGWVKDKETGLKHICSIGISYEMRASQGSILPDNFDKLSYLKEFIIYFGPLLENRFLPKSLFKCPLKMLDIEGGNFEGEIPAEIINLKRTLMYLAIKQTNMSGSIPKEIGDFDNIQRIFFEGNRFSGQIPFEYNRCIQNCYLENNEFTSIDWRYFTEVQEGHREIFIPYCRRNKLNGKVPKEVLESARWKQYYWRVLGQKEGYDLVTEY